MKHKFYFCGNALSINKDIYKWFEEVNVSRRARKYIRRIGTHNWAGNLEGKHIIFEKGIAKRRKRHCFFIRNNVASLRWDGTVVSCCFDSENDNVLGHIEDFPHLRHQPDRYKLCNYCDRNWANKEMF